MAQTMDVTLDNNPAHSVLGDTITNEIISMTNTAVPTKKSVNTLQNVALLANLNANNDVNIDERKENEYSLEQECIFVHETITNRITKFYTQRQEVL